MKRLTILVDMDDTIEDLSGAWAEWLNSKYGLHTHRDELRDWDVAKAFPSLSAGQVYAPLYDDSFWSTVRPINDAPEFLFKLIEDGHKVFIVTASAYETIKAKMNGVLFRYFPYLTWDDVIVTSKKQIVTGDILVDDGPHNLFGGVYLPVLMDAPHNQKFNNEEHKIPRVYGWKEVYELITEYAGG